MAEARLDILGADQVRALLQRVPEALEDPSELHEWYVIAAQSYALDHFPSSPGLKPITLASRARGGSKPLFDQGQLFRALTGGGSQKISTEPGTLNEANQRWGRLGVNLIQARLLNEGGVVTPKASKFLAVPMSRKAGKAGGPRDFPGDLVPWPMKKREGWLLVEGQKVTITRGPRKGQQRVRARVVDQGRPVAHYMLTKKIVIPGWHYMPTVAQLVPDLVDATDRWTAMKLAGKAA